MRCVLRASVLVAATLAASVSASAQPRSTALTATVDAGPQYEWLIDSHFMGAAATAFIGRQFPRWAIGGRAHFFGGDMVASPTAGWSISSLDFTFGPMAELFLRQRLRLQAGVGLQVTKLLVRHCFDAGDGCWWSAPGNNGGLSLVDVNVGVNLQLGLDYDLWRSTRTTLFVSPRVEYTGYLLSFDHYSSSSALQLSRSAVATEVVVGLRF